MQQGVVSVSGSNSVAVPCHGKKSRRGEKFGMTDGGIHCGTYATVR